MKIKDIAIEVSERESDPKNSGYPRFVGLEHYDSGCVRITRFGRTDNLDSCMKIFHSGDVLVARRNVYLKRAGAVDFDGLTSGDSIVLRAKNDEYAKILPFILNSDEFWKYAAQHSDGSMSKRLSPSLLLQFSFNLPRNNTAFLEKLDLLLSVNRCLEATKSLAYETRNLVWSKFSDLFGDLDSDGSPFPKKSFSDFALFDTKMTTDFAKYANYPHIGIENIEKDTGCLFGYKTVAEDNVISGKYIFNSDDIIYSKIRPNLNKVAMPTFDGLCSADAYPIKPKANTNKVFLAYLLRSRFFLDYILKTSKRANMPKTNRKSISGFSIHLPPKKIQDEYAVFAEKAEDSIQRLHIEVARLSQLLSRLISEVITR